LIWYSWGGRTSNQRIHLGLSGASNHTRCVYKWELWYSGARNILRWQICAASWSSRIRAWWYSDHYCQGRSNSRVQGAENLWSRPVKDFFLSCFSPHATIRWAAGSATVRGARAFGGHWIGAPLTGHLSRSPRQFPGISSRIRQYSESISKYS
jgi:hypothetical protein